MVARVVPQSARRRHAESRKPDLRGVVARPKAPVLGGWYTALRKHWGGLERVAALMASVRDAAAKRAQATLRC